MKKLIHEIEEQSGNHYQLWAELTPCSHPEGYKALKFFSMYSGSKTPDKPWVKGQFFLSPEALANLKDLLDEVETVDPLDVYNEERLVSKYDKQRLNNDA